MSLEIARLCLGLLIAGFHEPIADFVLEREKILVVVLQERGVLLPPAMTREAARNLYFSLGIVVTLIELLRLLQMVR